MSSEALARAARGDARYLGERRLDRNTRESLMQFLRRVRFAHYYCPICQAAGGCLSWCPYAK